MRFYLLVLLAVSLLLGACDYDRGYEDGKRDSAESAEANYDTGYSEGYDAGYLAARPHGTLPVTEGTADAIEFAGFLGAIKIIGGLALCAIMVSFGINTWPGQTAAGIAAVFAALSAIILTNLTYADRLLASILLLPANWNALFLLVPLVGGALVGYGCAALLKAVITSTDEIGGQIVAVFTCSFLASFMTTVLYRVFFTNPEPAGYVVTYLLAGVAAGVLLWLIHYLMGLHREMRRAKAAAKATK